MKYPDTLKPFAMNPGELLAAVLRARKIEKTDFGLKVGATYQTVNRWTKNKGFTPKKQRLCADALKLEPNYFELSDHDDRARAREAYRRQVFLQFLETDIGRRLVETDPDVIAALDTTQFPAGKRPSVDAFSALALLFTRQLDPDDMPGAVRFNESVSNSLLKSTDGQPRSKKTPRKKPTKRL
jgi:hypothetical protein